MEKNERNNKIGMGEERGNGEYFGYGDSSIENESVQIGDAHKI